MNKICRIGMLIFLILFFQTLKAQDFMKEKRIYLLDITSSMIGTGDSEDIFDRVKINLIDAINEIDEQNTEVLVIPYTTRTYKPIKGSKEYIIERLKSLQTKRENTNIANAWQEGINNLDSTKVNYMFLLTDGKHNTGVDQEKFYQTLCDWESISHNKYYFSFYVMLTSNAEDEKIRSIASATPQMWKIIDMNVNATFIRMPFNLRMNIFSSSTKDYEIKHCNHFNELQKLGYINVKLQDNPYYRIERTVFDSKNPKLIFHFKELMPKSSLPLSIDLKAKITVIDQENQLFFFTPDEFTITIENKGKKTVSFKQRSDLFHKPIKQ